MLPCRADRVPRVRAAGDGGEGGACSNAPRGNVCCARTRAGRPHEVRRELRLVAQAARQVLAARIVLPLELWSSIVF